MQCMEPQNPSLQFSLEQAELVAEYLRCGGTDREFLRIHVTALLQSVLQDVPNAHRPELIACRYS